MKLSGMRLRTILDIIKILDHINLLRKFSLRYDQRKVSGLLYCAFDQDYSGPGLKKIAGFSTIFQEGNFRFS